MVFKIGDKVRMKSKRIGIRFIESNLYENMIGYVVKIYGDGSGKDLHNCLGVWMTMKTGIDSIGGDFFSPHDLVLIERDDINEFVNDINEFVNDIFCDVFGDI